MRRWVLIASLAMASLPHAASRARYGGTLRIAVSAAPYEADPLLADSPIDAALLGMVSRSICSLDGPHRVRPTLAREISRTAPLRLRVALRPHLTFASGAPVAPTDLAASWSRPSLPGAPSPYRALLFPLRAQRRISASMESSHAIDLELAFPWPDLEASLCHPSLAIAPASSPRSAGIGPYIPARTGGMYEANLAFPAGRPYPDRALVSFADERGVARLLELKQADVALGQGETQLFGSASALYATYLVFQPDRVGSQFRQAFEASIDRSDLTRLFVRGPSLPMTALLPPALMPQQSQNRPSAPAISSAREISLAFDRSVPDQRAVAERIQVKLHDLKYKIALRPVARSQLRTLWATGEYDLILHALLLPPTPAPALAVAIDGAGRHDLLASELPPLGAIADDAARDAAARERAKILERTLPSIPLYVQALGATLSPAVVGLHADGQGLPALDDCFLATNPAP